MLDTFKVYFRSFSSKYFCLPFEIFHGFIFNIRFSVPGMLTITDFINILHRYYKSPMVSARNPYVCNRSCVFLRMWRGGGGFLQLEAQVNRRGQLVPELPIFHGMMGVLGPCDCTDPGVKAALPTACCGWRSTAASLCRWRCHRVDLPGPLAASAASCGHPLNSSNKNDMYSLVSKK